MSNILTPIVARYSVFFTLAMCSSSSISRSKQPTHLVQTLLLQAQQRYQDKSTEKMRAVVRHLSTTSTSSSSLSQQSAPSQLTSVSTEISSPSSLQAISPSPSSFSRTEPPSSPIPPPLDNMPSLPPEGSLAGKSFEHSKEEEDTKQDVGHNHKSATFVSTLDRTEHDYQQDYYSPINITIYNNHNSNTNGNNNDGSSNGINSNTSSSSSSQPCSPHAREGAAAAIVTTVDATVSSDRSDQQQQISTLPSPSSSISIAAANNHRHHHANKQQQQHHSHLVQGSKVSRSSIAALLSVTLTMILLSLLQSKKRHIRRKGRSPRGTTSKRHSKGARQLLLHRDGYKSTSTDQLTHRSHSPSSHTIITLTDMEGTTTSEGAQSLLTQFRPASFYGGVAGLGEPASVAIQPTLSSRPPSTHGLALLDSSLPIPPSTPTNPNTSTLHFESTTRLLHHGNMYSGRDVGFSLSDSNLPDKRSKRDLVTDWLDQQTFVSPDQMESPEPLPIPPAQDSHGNDEPLHFLLPHHQQQHLQQLQQQLSAPSRQLDFPAQFDPSQLYHQHSINNSGAQREPRQQGPEHRAIQRLNDLHPGSRSSLYRSPSARHSMVALDQPSPRLSQQQQQQSSSPSFWRESSSQPQSQFTPQQYRLQYPHYPQHIQHHPSPSHVAVNAHGHYYDYYQQPYQPSSSRTPYESPHGYENLDLQDSNNHRRSLSLNSSGGRDGRGFISRSRPESQVYRKATIARFENLSLAEQARQEHQMRRQHYQQHYQHRHQQQQQYQHQQYSQGRNSRPTSMYSTGHAAPLAHTMGSPPRHHQHQHQHPRPRVLHQARHPHDHRLSMVSTSKGNISASRSANDLAWERHCYYQQQQMQEDALAERKRIEQHQMKLQRPLSTVEGLQVPNVASQVVRTSSMSRISSSSNVVVASASPGPIGRRAAAGATMAQSSTAAAAGLSRSVSTSAIGDAKARAAKKDKAMHRSSSKKNKESPSSSSPSSPTSETEPKASSTIDCKFLRLLRRSDSKLTKTTSANAQTKANTESPSGQQAQPIGNNDTPSKDQSTNVTNQHLESTPAAATTGLSRRRTLKDIGPSIRSLARRCSSRFSSTRPSSFAGSGSDPVISFSEGKVPAQRGSNSLSMTTSYLPLKISLGAVPRSLSPGPDGVIDLRQVAAAAQGQEQQKSPSSVSVKYFPPASSGSPSLSLKDLPQPQPEPEQRVPIHRRVTLFRSKTVSLSKASSKKIPAIHVETIDTTPTTVPIASAMADDTSKSSARANSLHNRSRKRESLRLANGHGLDFDISRSSNFSSNTPADARDAAAEEASAVERSTNDLESALPVTTGRLSDMDQQQKARRQIISLLAMGRKDRISAKTGHAMKPSPSPASSTISQLSPLALEAQEDLFADSASSSGGDGGEKKKEGEDGEEDPCERIAFMLVPKSRYEFQPLVVA